MKGALPATNNKLAKHSCRHKDMSHRDLLRHKISFARIHGMAELPTKTGTQILLRKWPKRPDAQNVASDLRQDLIFHQGMLNLARELDPLFAIRHGRLQPGDAEAVR